MLKKQQVLIYQIFPRKQNLKSNIYKLDIDELKAVPDQLNNLKSKLNDTNVDKVDFKKFQILQLKMLKNIS